MWCIQYLVGIVGFVILERLDSILLKGETNIKGTLRIERRLLVSIATFEKIRDTRQTGTRCYFLTTKRTGRGGNQRSNLHQCHKSNKHNE